MTSLKLGAQCTNTSAFGTASAPAPGTSITAVSCQYAGEYATITFTAGNTYSIASTVLGDYFTVRSGSSSGPVEVAGAGPLIFTPTSTATYYVHCNLNAACGTQSTCRNILIGCYGTSCNFTSAFGTGVAPAVNSTVVLTTCNYGGEYATVTSVVAGNYYRSISSVGTDYFTIRSGSASGPVVANGLSPLTWTAQVSGTHYVHVATSSLCATASVCRSNSLTCTGPGAPPAPPANDLCANATTLAVPGSTAGTTVNSTIESPSPGTCGTSLSQPGVWYKVVGNGNQFGADLCAASAWDSKIFVYRGSCGSWTCVTGNDDGGPICTGAAASATWCTLPSVDYFILVTGFSSANTFTIALTQTVNPSTPTVAVSAASPSVCLTLSTALTATGASTYLWNTGATTSTIAVTPTATTVYTVTGRAATGCGYDIKTVTVTSMVNPTVTISASSASICPGGSFVINASGANSYTFNGSPSGTFVATAGAATLSPIVNTTYTVYGTATNGCRSLLAASPVATLITLASPTLVTIASPSSVCPNATSTITVTGANTYTWLAPASNATQISVSPSVTTIYTVSGTGTNVCNGFKTVTVTTYPEPTISVNSGTSCAGSIFTLTPTGAVSYTYSGGSNTVAPTTSTFYTVSGTNTFGCVSATTAISNITVSALPVVTASSGTMCNGSFFNIIPGGATSYTIIGAGNPVSPSVTTTYSVIGSTSVGCASLPALSTVTVFNLPNVTAVSSPSSNVICDTSPITMNASGASTYTWNGTVSGASISATPSTSGSYFVIGTDANGCTNVATIPFTVNPLPALAFAATNTFVCAGGSATLISGGALNYTWTTGSNSTLQVVSPTVSTVYGLTGDNSFGCTKTLTLSVNVNTIVMTVSSNTAVCIGNSVDLNASGATNYTWAPVPSPFSNVNVTPSVTSSYTVIGKDSKNCFHTAVITVSVNPNPVVSASTSNSIICVGESATLTATGASAYLWSIASSTNNTGSPLVVTPTQANTFNYVVTGTDANECSGTDTVMVKVEKCTGITSISKEMNGISVYPNPNNGSFKVELINGLKKSISVTDVSGRLILSTESSEDVIDVNLNTFANGIYYVKVQSESTLEVIQVIKQ